MDAKKIKLVEKQHSSRFIMDVYIKNKTKHGDTKMPKPVEYIIPIPMARVFLELYEMGEVPESIYAPIGELLLMELVDGKRPETEEENEKQIIWDPWLVNINNEMYVSGSQFGHGQGHKLLSKLTEKQWEIELYCNEKALVSTFRELGMLQQPKTTSVLTKGDLCELAFKDAEVGFTYDTALPNNWIQEQMQADPDFNAGVWVWDVNENEPVNILHTLLNYGIIDKLLQHEKYLYRLLKKCATDDWDKIQLCAKNISTMLENE